MKIHLSVSLLNKVATASGKVSAQLQPTRKSAVLYGTNESDSGTEPDPDKVKEQLHTVWTRCWKFLITDETLTSWVVTGNFKGLKLPKDVIEKIYYKNAVKKFPEFKKLYIQ